MVEPVQTRSADGRQLIGVRFVLDDDRDRAEPLEEGLGKRLEDVVDDGVEVDLRERDGVVHAVTIAHGSARLSGGRVAPTCHHPWVIPAALARSPDARWLVAG